MRKDFDSALTIVCEKIGGTTVSAIVRVLDLDEIAIAAFDSATTAQEAAVSLLEGVAGRTENARYSDVVAMAVVRFLDKRCGGTGDQALRDVMTAVRQGSDRATLDSLVRSNWP